MGKNLDLLLVHPPIRKKIYQDLADDLSAKEPPYIAALTAEFVRRQGFQVRILDADAENLDIRETVDAVKSYSPDLVQIVVHGQQPSASTQMMDGVGKLCKNIREEIPEQKILLTGTHPSSLPVRTLTEESIDYVGDGEGFNTVLGLLQNRMSAQIPGLWYKQDGKIIKGALDRLMTSSQMDLLLPRAAWDLLPMDKYRAHNWHCFGNPEERTKYASIYTSFGCPFKCEFCCINAPFINNGEEIPRLRCRSPDKVMEEIDILVNDYGVKNIKFIDELFVLRKAHYVTIANKLKERGYNLNIWAYARVDSTKEEDLETLKNAGINWLALGIESASDDVRKEVVKGKFGVEDIKSVIEKIKRAGIYIGGNYIFGLPGDTLESMRSTLDLAKEVNSEWANFYCAMAYPGSKLHKLAENKNIPKPSNWDANIPLLPEDAGGPGWIGYSQHAYETLPLPTSTLYPEEVLRFRDDSFQEYFKNGNYLEMIKNRFGAEAVRQIEKMNSYKLRRKILGD